MEAVAGFVEESSKTSTEKSQQHSRNFTCFEVDIN